MSADKLLKKEADKIFLYWKACLQADKDKLKTARCLENFGELFSTLHTSGIDSEMAEEYIRPAIAAHTPKNGDVTNTYKMSHHWKKRYSTEKEFGEAWRELFENNAIKAYTEYYPPQMPGSIPVPGSAVTGTEKKPSKMTPREKAELRSYVESFERLPYIPVSPVEEKVPEPKKAEESVNPFDDMDLGLND